MTIQEALNSGKAFRRPGMASWLRNVPERLQQSDILAEDWEVKNPSEVIKVSENLLRRAMKKAAETSNLRTSPVNAVDVLIDETIAQLQTER